MIHSREALAAEVRAAFASAAMTGREHRTVAHEFRVRQQDSQPVTGAVGRWFVTLHAVNAFRSRAGGASWMTYERALGEIINESTAARKLKDLDSGAELWRGPRPRRLRYIVMPDERYGLPVLVTVLFAFDRSMQ